MQAVAKQHIVVKQWIAAFLVGALSLLAFIVLGHTPVIRALGMAAAISGVTLILQRFGLMFAVPLFLAGHSTVSWHALAEVLAWLCGIPSLVLSYYAAAEYVPIGRAALEEGRRRRAAR